jgi:hypothetical protein
MATQRIKGQEVSVEIIKDSRPLDTINIVRSFDFEYELETKSEGYLGETTDRKDSVFRGIKGRMELHTNNKDIFTLIQTAVDKARDRTSGVRINIKATLAYPNGDRVRVTIIDVEFGTFPVKAGSRSDYITVDLDFVASEARTVI